MTLPAGRYRLARAALLASAVVAGACGGDGGDGAASQNGGHDDHGGAEGQVAKFARGEADKIVDVTMVDFAYRDLPSTIKGRKVFFSVRNDGPSAHEFIVFSEAGGSLGGVHINEVGKTDSAALTLEPGRYAVQCLLNEGNRTHAELGMKATFAVE